MDVRAWLGLVAAIGAFVCIYSMETGLRRWARMRLNRWHRERMRNGFRMKRANNFRDGALL